MTDIDVPRLATAQLLALAAACRPDWSMNDLQDVLAQARTQGMSFSRALVVVAQMIADPQAEPPDLLAELPEAWRQRRRPTAPETATRGAAAVRAALHHTNHTD